MYCFYVLQCVAFPCIFGVIAELLIFNYWWTEKRWRSTALASANILQNKDIVNSNVYSLPNCLKIIHYCLKLSIAVNNKFICHPVTKHL